MKVIDELANQILLRRAEQQQAHMYRQIAADALAEGDNLHQALEQAHQDLEAARRETRELKVQVTKLQSADAPPATPIVPPSTRRRTTRFAILP